MSLGRERSWAALFCNALIQLTFSTSHKEYIKRQILFVSDSKILPCEHVCRIKVRNWLLTVIVNLFFSCVFFVFWNCWTELFEWLLLIIVRTAIEGKESKRLSLHLSYMYFLIKTVWEIGLGASYVPQNCCNIS